MKTLRRRLVVGILVVLAGLTVHAQTATPSAPTLLALLSPENCTRTCFIGIQPGITTLAEFRNILSARGITYYVNSLDGNEANANLEWRLPLTGLGFTYGARSSTFVNTSFSNGIVRQMSIGLDIPIQTIIADYGQPQQYRIADSIAYYLVYSQHKMIFQPISTDSTELAQLIMLFDDSAFNEFLNDSGLDPVTNCTQPTSICSVQTATPTPLPSSATLAEAASATSTDVPVPTLRETFNAPSCVVSCWDVIQPNKTTQSQLEVLLVQRGITY
ncbi:MAG: hypothetical protein JNJ61_22910, partial [Anaerolineae bacterium]|nr:hypothetical protein [Anaerolineae bacterium]